MSFAAAIETCVILLAQYCLWKEISKILKEMKAAREHTRVYEENMLEYTKAIYEALAEQ